MAKVIVAGSRIISDPALVERAIEESGFHITELVCGCADGVDTLAMRWAKKRRIPVRYFRPDWKNQGKSAGPRRNTLMAKYASQLIAIWDGSSAGTKDMINQARQHGLDIYVKNI